MRRSDLFPIVPLGQAMLGAAALEWRGPGSLARAQGARVRSLVRHAYHHVPYYRETWLPDDVAAVHDARDLSRLPVLEPGMLRDTPAARMLAEGIDQDTCLAVRTSGSTGTPRTVLFSSTDMNVIRGRYLWDLLVFGFRPWDRVAYIRFAPFRHHRLERLGLMPSCHVDSTKPLAEQARDLLAARPTAIIAFPNLILSIVEELERQGVGYDGTRLVVFGGERTTPEVRRFVLEQLGARGCETYACTEANVIARQCRRGALHLRATDVVVEVEHDDGSVSVADGVGDILVTPLQARAMPIVRYRVGDRVEIGPDDCGCGRSRRPILHSVLGRTDDRVTDRTGRQMNAQQVVTAVEGVPGIRRLQLHQHVPGAINVHVVAAPDAPLDLVARVEEAARRISSQFDIAVRLVDDVDREPSGKIRLVRQHATAAAG